MVRWALLLLLLLLIGSAGLLVLIIRVRVALRAAALCLSEPPLGGRLLLVWGGLKCATARAVLLLRLLLLVGLLGRAAGASGLGGRVAVIRRIACVRPRLLRLLPRLARLLARGRPTAGPVAA